MSVVHHLGWLVSCFEFNDPLRQYFSLYRAVSLTGRMGRENIEEGKSVQTPAPHTRTYCKRNRPLPYYQPKCRTPRHLKFTQDHRTTRPHPHHLGDDCTEKFLLGGTVKFLKFGTPQTFAIIVLKNRKV